MNEINEMLEEMVKLLNEVVSISVVGMDGLVIAEYTADDSASTDYSSAKMTSAIVDLIQLVEEINMGKMVDNLLSTESGHFLTKQIGDGSIFLSIVCKRGANLGAMRYVSKVYNERIWNLLPHN